jgi:exodeoxyribonuclease VIII
VGNRFTVPIPGTAKISDAIYHGGELDHILSCSGMKALLKSPKHFDWWLKTDKEPTDAMKLGSAFHSRLLEGPEIFASEFAVMEDHDARTKDGKAYRAQFEAENLGKTVLKKDAMLKIEAMISSVLSNKYASQLLNSKEGIAELAHFWISDDVHCRGKFDFIRPDDGIIVDVKTTADLMLENFERRAADLLYHMQAAFYLDGSSQIYGKTFSDFYIIAIENDEPFDVAVYLYNHQSIDQGRSTYKKALNVYRSCKESKTWPGIGNDILDLSIPVWKMEI